MLALAEIIIGRIRDAHEVRRIKKLAAGEGEESVSGKRMQQLVGQIERRENVRLKEEIASLEALQSLSLYSE